MKILFDQNISHRILKFIDSVYKSSYTIKSEGLINANDKEIWGFAKKNNYSIFSPDSDFNELF